jgi:hypothetical protein
VVCVRMPPAAGRKHRTSHLQTVPATVPAITELAAELVALGAQMVSMEATSDYWRIWFMVLEEAGLAVQLVSSSSAANDLPGPASRGMCGIRVHICVTNSDSVRTFDSVGFRDLAVAMNYANEAAPIGSAVSLVAAQGSGTRFGDRAGFCGSGGAIDRSFSVLLLRFVRDSGCALAGG